MSVSAGSKTSNNGLVLLIDMYNSKSWKGKPTVNLITTPRLDSLTGWTTAGGTPGVPREYDLRTDEDEPYLNIRWERDSDTGNTWGWIRNNQRYTTKGNMSLSCEVRVNHTAGSEGQIRLAAVVNDYWTPVRKTRQLTASDIGKGWQRVELTTNYDSDTYYRTVDRIPYALDGCFEIYSGAQDQPGEVLDFDLRRVQMEYNDFATQFVDGTRSTPSIVDLKNNEAITISSLTYDSDKSFSFVNSDFDKIRVDHSTNISVGSEFTIEMWINPAATQDNLYPYIMWKGSLLMHINQNPVNSYVAMNVSTSAGLRQTIGSGIVNPNRWNHVVGTYDGQVGRVYHNGVLANSNDFGSVVSINSSTSDLYIGGSDGTTRQFNGKIASYRQYNRALTDAEIKNNYVATRRKFGL